MFKTCLENRIILRQKCYKCYLCHYETPENAFTLALKHVEHQDHKKNLDKVDNEVRIKESEVLLTISETQRRKLVENGITLCKTFYYFRCHICKDSYCGLISIFDHIKTSIHIQKINTIADNKANSNPPEKNKVAGNNDNAKHLLNENNKNLDNVKKEMSEQTNSGKPTFKTAESKPEQTINTKKPTISTADAFSCIVALEQPWFRCKICECDINGESNTREHAKGRSHLIMLKLQKELALKSTMLNTIENKASTMKLELQKAKDIKPSKVKTIENKESTMKLELQKAKDIKPSMVKTFENKESTVKSFITKIEYCTSCQVFLKSPKVVQFHVKLHLFKEFPIPDDIDIIKFKISRSGKAIIQCLLCNSFIANEEELEKHLNIPHHIANYSLFDKIGDIIKLEKTDVIAIEQEKLTKFEIDHSKCSSNALLCTLCDALIMKNSCDEHLNGKNHLTKVQALDISNTYSISSSNENIAATYDCFLCKRNYSDFIKLFCHYSTHEHQRRLKCFKIVTKDPYTRIIDHKDYKMFTCTLCNTKHLHCYSAIQHLMGKNHSKHLEAQEINAVSNTASISAATSTSSIVELKSKQIVGKTDKKVTELQLKQNNKKTNNNIIQLQSKQNNEIPSVIKTKQKIDPIENKESTVKSPNTNCQVFLKNPKPKTKKKKNEFETSPEELLKLGFSVENLNLMEDKEFKFNFEEPFDDVLNDLVNFDLNRTQEKKLPLSFKGKKPRMPNTEKKKLNSFSKNVKLHGKNYIKLCITSGKENIYNVDSEDLRLMKLGCDFIFPWESEKVCLPCAEPLPNNKLAVYEHLQDEVHIITMQEMEANDKEFEDYPEQYSDLKLAHLYMGEESDDWIQCYVCNTKIKNENLNILQHSLTTDHLTKSQQWKKLSGEIFQGFSDIFKDIWYYAQVFICEICQAKYDFEIDFVMHLKSEKHKNKVASLKGNKFCICPVCITYWYGKSDSFKIHCKDSYHKRLANNGDLMIPNMTRNALNFLSSISLKVKSMIEESNKAVFERYKESALIEAIEETVQCKYPKAKAYIFGSRLSQLAFCDSDADVFLDCEGVYYDSTTQEQCQKYLSSIRCYFENNPYLWIVEEIIMVTRVPIIKLRHIPTQLKCDISFINGLSVEKSTLIGNYNEAFVICRELILYLKKWLNICQISGSDCITTFAISWFVIFYLQVQGILPSVYELIRKNNQTKIIDGWECGFLEKIPVNSLISNLNFSEHLYGFFSFYASFDYKTEVICPYLGKAIKKSTFAYADNLPKEMKIYKDRLKGEKCDIFRFDSPMCIQDPIDLSQNMTKAVKKRQLRCFRKYCTESAFEVSKEIEI